MIANPDKTLAVVIDHWYFWINFTHYFSFLSISQTFHLAMQMIFDHLSYFDFCSESRMGRSLRVILNHYL